MESLWLIGERIAARSEKDSQRPQDAGNAGETQQQPRVQVESTPAGSNIPYVQAYDTQTGQPLGGQQVVNKHTVVKIKTKKLPIFITALAGCACGALLVIALIMSGTLDIGGGRNAVTAGASGSSTQKITIDSEDTTLAEAVSAKALPSVVSITATSSGSQNGSLSQSADESDSSGSVGSGVVLETEGHILTNNHVVDVKEREGSKAVVPGLLDFFLYSMSNAELQKDELGSAATTRAGRQALIKLVDWRRTPVEEMLEKSRRFEAPERIDTMADKARTVLSVCNNMGEGWLLTAEMLDLIDHGAPNIICTQPFACLPNHVVGKAVIKELRRQRPESNIVAVDYDPGASEVSRLNRVKLMISVATDNMRAGKGFKLEKVAPLAMEEVTGQMRAHDGCVSCGSVDESAVASVAERLGRGIKK